MGIKTIINIELKQNIVEVYSKKIFNYLDENKLSKTKFAKLCGISLKNLNIILSKKEHNFEEVYKTLIKIYKTTGLEFYSLLY